VNAQGRPAPANGRRTAEGPPDMVSARVCGMPALAVPGDQAWDSAWDGQHDAAYCGHPVAVRRSASAFRCDKTPLMVLSRVLRLYDFRTLGMMPCQDSSE
jgi:hypothetical protein